MTPFKWCHTFRADVVVTLFFKFTKVGIEDIVHLIRPFDFAIVCGYVAGIPVSAVITSYA